MLTPVELRVIEDQSPEDYILETIEDEDFDLLVMGSEGGHSAFRRIFLVTISTKLLNEALCDVIIVR